MTDLKWLALVAILAEIAFWTITICVGRKYVMRIKDKGILWAIAIGIVVALVVTEIIIRVVGPLHMSL